MKSNLRKKNQKETGYVRLQTCLPRDLTAWVESEVAYRGTTQSGYLRELVEKDLAEIVEKV